MKRTLKRELNKGLKLLREKQSKRGAKKGGDLIINERVKLVKGGVG